MQTVRSMEQAVKTAHIKLIEEAVNKSPEFFASKLMVAPDLLNGINGETVDYILATLLESGQRDALEIIRNSVRCGKRTQSKINTLLLARSFNA